MKTPEIRLGEPFCASASYTFERALNQCPEALGPPVRANLVDFQPLCPNSERFSLSKLLLARLKHPIPLRSRSEYLSFYNSSGCCKPCRIYTPLDRDNYSGILHGQQQILDCASDSPSDFERSDNFFATFCNCNAHNSRNAFSNPILQAPWDELGRRPFVIASWKHEYRSAW